jgi:hypothetical protein
MMLPDSKGEEHLVEVCFVMDDMAPTQPGHTEMLFWISPKSKGMYRFIFDWAIQGGGGPYTNGVEHAADCTKLLKNLDQPEELTNSPNQILTVRYLEGDQVLAKRFAIDRVPAEVHEILTIMGVRDRELHGRLKFSSERPNKTLQATAAVPLVSEVAWRHNAVVAGARALPAAVPELGR